jgi:hypothetical protein
MKRTREVNTTAGGSDLASRIDNQPGASTEFEVQDALAASGHAEPSDQRGAHAEMENFSNLSARLAEIEAEHIGADGGNAEEARETLVLALSQYRASRFRLGKALLEYKTLFTADRGWMAAAKSVAGALGCDERTVRNIISDYELVAKLPAAVIQAAHSKGFDLAQRKHSSKAAAIKAAIESEEVPEDIDEEKAERIVSNLFVMPSPAEREQLRDDPFVPLSREEKQRFAIRMKIRTALTNIEPDQRLSALIAALEEEMFAVWGQNDPVTVTITPRASGLTFDGRKRREDVA